jgi:methylglutaconyl-CoA hydratase
MGPVGVGIDGRIATVTLNRPERHNAFDDAIIAELTEALRSVETDSRVRLLVLAAAGKSFSAGADLDWMRRMADFGEVENLADAKRLATLLQTLNFMAKPTSAVVQGAALGGGVGLAAACDIVIARPEAVFGLTEVRLGLIPAVISPYVAQAIGERAARRYFLTGERFDAKTAVELGLVTEISADLPAAIGRFSEMLLAGGPEAQAAAKKLIRRVGRGTINAAMIDDTAERIARTRSGAEAREGIAAFFEKRRPLWLG